VLDVAASVVGLLKRFFADHIDSLRPEEAFLEAPHLPLLLPAATPGNVAMLLSGGDPNEAWKVGGWVGGWAELWRLASGLHCTAWVWACCNADRPLCRCCRHLPLPLQTEFGANQVVLRRSLGAAVPRFLAKVDAVIMTIPQAKGLEFNGERAWMVLDQRAGWLVVGLCGMGGGVG
jgi:hypothetical protein